MSDLAEIFLHARQNRFLPSDWGVGRVVSGS
jgi:hypothetical protein